ncbi:MAG: DCC1-like thiol-disulfide oxidoreductase family protein [Acidobacteriia bacterium]|nr:DCC1-like thiol-disulfide oxidoreductase family protein [Terriglobia bacterium]
MPPESPATDTIYYDGHCGLCHRWVRFVVAVDRDGRLFRFAPLAGETFQAKVPQSARAGLPDSVILQTADGSLMVRSDAVVCILRRLGAGWWALGAAIHLIPRPVRDGAYDWIARMRTRWFAPPAGTCPVMPAELRKRFDP